MKRGTGCEWNRQLLLQELHYCDFLRAQAVQRLCYCLFIVVLERGEQFAVEIGVDNFWMNITFTANCRGVTQLLRSRFYSLSQVLFCLRLSFRFPHFRERANRK